MKQLRSAMALLLVLSMLPMPVSATEAAAEDPGYPAVIQALEIEGENLPMEETDAKIPDGMSQILSEESEKLIMPVNVEENAGHAQVLQTLQSADENLTMETRKENRPDDFNLTLPTEEELLIMPADVGDNEYYEAESNNSEGSANRIYNDYTVSGYLSGYDLDFFKFTLTSTTQVNIIAVASYSSFAMLVYDSNENAIGVDSTGSYSDGYYAYNLSGELSSGTYYICLIDTAARSRMNVYTFYLEYETRELDAPAIRASVDAASGKPKLTWKAVDDANSYWIYRSSTQGGTYSVLDFTYSTSYIDSEAIAGSKYYYKVDATNSSGVSDYSNIVSYTCDLPRPTGVKVTNDTATGKNKISWNAVEGAAKYQVWHSTTGKTGSFKLLMTTKNLSHTHKASVAGKMHYYKVKAIHSNTDANSALTGASSRVCDLAKPTGVKISAGTNGKNKITWNAVEGAAKYQVWFSKSGKAGSFSLLVTKNASALTHTHKAGVAGQKYFYKIKAVHTNTNANSAYSAVVNRISK